MQPIRQEIDPLLLRGAFSGNAVIGRLNTGHRGALQNRQVNGIVNMPELWFLPV
jgi:hypothetical protein